MLNERGVFKSVFIFVLFLLGVVLWLLFQSFKKDYSAESVKFNNAFTGLLIKNSISDADVISQTRQEKKTHLGIWVEYYWEIELPLHIDEIKFERQIKAVAKNKGLNFGLYDMGSKGRIEIEIKQESRVYSKIVIYKSKKEAYKKKVAIVIDDLGYKKDISEFLSLKIPITYAVLPNEPYSKHIALKLSNLKMPFIMHLPLEPKGYPETNPGDSALLLNMPDDKIIEKLNKNIKSVPGISGVNNHMGSAFTENEEKMKVVLKEIKKQGMFFLDSYTTPDTKVKEAAQSVGIKFLENQVFLDLEDDREYMKKQFDRVLKKLETQDYCIAIGHIHKKELPGVIEEYKPKFKENKIGFVFITDLINDKYN